MEACPVNNIARIAFGISSCGNGLAAKAETRRVRRVLPPSYTRAFANIEEGVARLHAACAD